MSASPSATPWPLEDPNAFYDYPMPAPVLQPAYANEQFADVIALDQSAAEARTQQTYVLKPKLSAWILAGAAMVFAVVFAFVMWPSDEVAKKSAADTSSSSQTTDAEDPASGGGTLDPFDVAPGGADPAPMAAAPKTAPPVSKKPDPLDDVMDLDGPLPAPMRFDSTPRPTVPAPAVEPVNPSATRRPGSGAASANSSRPAAPSSARPAVGGGTAPGAAAATTGSPAAPAATTPAAMVHVAVPNNGAWGYTDVDPRRVVLLTNAGTTNVTGALRGYVWSGTAWTQAYVLPAPAAANTAPAAASATGGGAPMKH